MYRNVILTGNRGLTKKIKIIANHKTRAEIIFTHSPNFKKQFSSFIKKVKYVFNKYAGFSYFQTFKTNNSPYQHILISQSYLYNNKFGIEKIYVYPDGKYNINKKFKNMFGRYIKIRKSRKSLNISQFNNEFISISLKPFGITTIFAGIKIINTYTPNIAVYFVHNKYNEKSKRYFKYLINKWIKAEKRFLNS